jgi:hypothetical protein
MQQVALESQRLQQRRLQAIDGALNRLTNDEFGAVPSVMSP